MSPLQIESEAAHNRRRSQRQNVGFYLNQIIDDAPLRSFTTDLSAIGLYMERPAGPLDRRSHTIQLEIPLPGAGETLWARGEVVYDRFDALFHGTAVRFTAMARRHQRMLRDWLHQTRRSTRFALHNPFRAEIVIHRPTA